MCVDGVLFMFRMAFQYTDTNKNRMAQLALYFDELVLYGLEKQIYARATSKQAGSETRGRSRERANVIETISKPLAAQRAGGIPTCLT